MSKEQDAAVYTLKVLGYTYHDGDAWKPPLGKSPGPLLAYIDRLELALHLIAGHGNITADRARTIAAEALGIQKPE